MAKVMVIDDDEQLRRMLQQMLEREGHEVACIGDGLEAVRRFKEVPADLVITDITMPGWDGIETMKELHKVSPELKVIVISGGGQRFPEIFLPMAKQAGAYSTLKKPFSRSDLLQVVEEALKLS